MLDYLDILRDQLFDLMRWGSIGVYCHDEKVIEVMRFVQYGMIKRSLEDGANEAESAILGQLNQRIRRILSK